MYYTIVINQRLLVLRAKLAIFPHWQLLFNACVEKKPVKFVFTRLITFFCLNILSGKVLILFFDFSFSRPFVLHWQGIHCDYRKQNQTLRKP